MSLPNCIDSKSDPNRARRLLDQIAAEAQSSRNSTPVVRAIRNVQQVTPKPSNRELQSISTTVSSPLRPAHGTFQATDSSRPQSWGGRSLRRNIDSAAQKLTQPFEQNGNVPDVLGEQSSGGEQILPVFGPPPKPNSVGSNRPSISHKRPHSPLISSPLGRTEREINPSFVGVMQISKDHGPMIKPEGVFPLKEESSGEEEEIVLERFQAFSSPRTPRDRTPMGPKASPERTFRASPLIASPTPTLVHCPRPRKGWERSDVYVKDAGRIQGNTLSPRNPPFEYIRSGGRVSPKTVVSQGLWQQPPRRSPGGWVGRRPVSPTPLTRTHQDTPRSYSNLAQHSIFPSAADRIQVEGLERMSSGEETFYGAASLSGTHHLDLEGLVSHDSPHPWPIAGGGHSDIYRGKLRLSSGRKIRVAIKMIRLPNYESPQPLAEERLKRLIREAHIWSNLKHENVLPFIGVCDDVSIAPFPVLISPFCAFGHVARYLRKNPSANKDHLVCGVASGLKFLHDNDIVHGDLKVQNVLVDKRGVPCICDFGISKILGRRGYTTVSVGTVPYMAPELFLVFGRDNTSGELPRTTKQSDVYSFALLALEILTSEPLKRRPSQVAVTSEHLQSLRPEREDYVLHKVSTAHWLALDPCWAFEPLSRPSIGEVLSSLPSRGEDAT